MKERFLRAKDFWDRHGNIIFFIGGFLFDAATMVRIDSWLDLALQAVYLAGITLLVILDQKVQTGAWTPKGFLHKVWHYNVEALHFFYGGLLSGYVVFYFKSTTAAWSVIFLIFIAFLMIINEMPQVRRAGSYMRLGLYAFCLVSFMTYLIPVVIGQMGSLIFLLGWFLSAYLSYRLARRLSLYELDPPTVLKQLLLSPALVLGTLLVLYFTKLIPPVPLSVQYAGVFHDVRRSNNEYELTYVKPKWNRFWRKDDRPFWAAPGDRIHVFARIFAPRKFTHRVFIRWQWKDTKGNWKTTDRIPMPIYGGRDQGFRGSATKSNYQPGEWRVIIETEDERPIGLLHLDVLEDVPDPNRELLTLRM